ncbi:TetR family transcriptional regulator [Paludibaculum fermentans]|uniref:TetR family transcriptional regulator n=1 Tax=Paludibaculum fermentans TaxID=1473598 RepID=UPI003EB853A4
MPSTTGLDESAKTGAAKTSLQARKLEFVRDAIWGVAIDLFAEKGFEETTIEDIVAAAGTSRRTFFRHFESKRDLVAQPVASYVDSLRNAIAAAPQQCSPAELFRHIVTQVAPLTVSETRMRKVMEISAKYPAAREAQLSRVAELQDHLAEAFAQRYPEGITAHILAALTLSTLSLVYRVWFAQGRQDIHSAVRQVLAELSKTACVP